MNAVPRLHRSFTLNACQRSIQIQRHQSAYSDGPTGTLARYRRVWYHQRHRQRLPDPFLSSRLSGTTPSYGPRRPTQPHRLSFCCLLGTLQPQSTSPNTLAPTSGSFRAHESFCSDVTRPTCSRAAHTIQPSSLRPWRSHMSIPHPEGQF